MMDEAWRVSVLSNGLMSITDWMLALSIFVLPLTMRRKGLWMRDTKELQTLDNSDDQAHDPPLVHWCTSRPEVRYYINSVRVAPPQRCEKCKGTGRV